MSSHTDNPRSGLPNRQDTDSEISKSVIIPILSASVVQDFNQFSIYPCVYARVRGVVAPENQKSVDGNRLLPNFYIFSTLIISIVL